MPIERANTFPVQPDLDDVAAVYAAYAPRCYALAYRLLRDADLAQDIVQETFLAWSSQPQRYEPARGSLGSWLTTITHHKAVDIIRRRANNPAHRFEDAELDRLICPQADVAETASQNERGRHIRHALSQLPEQHRTPILLAYFGGYTQTEIAARLNTPLGTIKYRTGAGMKQLRAHLGDLALLA